MSEYTNIIIGCVIVGFLVWALVMIPVWAEPKPITVRKITPASHNLNLYRLKIKKRTWRLCSKHVTYLGVGEIAILDRTNCERCK